MDLDSFAVDVEDHLVVSKSDKYDPEGIKSPDNIHYFSDSVRKNLKSFVITQPECPSFQIDGYQIVWQK